jgi:hypothetical protein
MMRAWLWVSEWARLHPEEMDALVCGLLVCLVCWLAKDG